MSNVNNIYETDEEYFYNRFSFSDCDDDEYEDNYYLDDEDYNGNIYYEEKKNKNDDYDSFPEEKKCRCDPYEYDSDCEDSDDNKSDNLFILIESMIENERIRQLEEYMRRQIEERENRIGEHIDNINNDIHNNIMEGQVEGQMNNINLDNIFERNVKLVIKDEEYNKLEKIEYLYINDEIKTINDKCVICIDNFNDKDKICILKCKHIYHQECIENWLKRKSHLCPCCRNAAGDYFFINM